MRKGKDGFDFFYFDFKISIINSLSFAIDIFFKLLGFLKFSMIFIV